VYECEEFFAKGQKGSSAMPHKRNPISSENITGCARVIRGYMLSCYENVPLWHERDISHSSVERIVMPDATILLDYMLSRFTRVLDNLVVFEDGMKENIEKTHGLVFSQRLLLMLIDKGVSREDAYDNVQPLAMQAWTSKTAYKPLVEQSTFIGKYLTNEEIDEAFSYEHHTKQVDTIFKRVGLA
jgi:adenylosuccinate lyase